MRKYKKLVNRANKKIKKLISNCRYSKNVERIKSAIASKKNAEVWKVIKNDLECQVVYENVSDLLMDGKLIDDPVEIANKFNDSFVNIRAKFPKTGSPALARNLMRDKNKNKNSFDFKSVTKYKVQNIIKQLNKKAAVGLDEFPNKLLLDNLELLLDPIVQGVNETISTENFPESLKLTKILPLHKKGSKKDLENYRPIAILPFLSKILEKVLYNQIYDYFEKNNLFTSSQFGFRKGKNTGLAVMTFLNQIRQLKNACSKESIVSIQFDLSKAFDLVDHDILIEKLKKYGFSTKACKLVRSFLSGRFQTTEVSKNGRKYHSNFTPSTAGVAQGSLLGPLLFLIYINDLPDFLEDNGIDLQTVIYADDINVVVKGVDIENKIKWVIDRVNKWVEDNNLKLNFAKTFILNFTKNILDFQSVKIGDKEIQTNQTVKYLGFFIDQQLNWHSHAKHIEKKIASRAFAIRKLNRKIDRESLMLYYHSNVDSIISYGIQLWGYTTGARDILLTQKKILRIIANKKKFDSCRKLFPEFNVMTVFSRYIYSTIKESIKLGYIIKEKLITNNQIQTRNILAKIEKKRGEKVDWDSLESRGIRYFNKLPKPLKELFIKSENSNLFLNNIKNYFIENPFYELKEYLDANLPNP